MSTLWSGEFERILRVYARYLGDDDPLDPEVPLLDLGIDSMAMVQMLVELEDELGIFVPDDLLTPEAFKTTATLWAMLAPLQATSLDASVD